MKTKLALLALSTATSLVADSCCEPCKPCCVPQPRAPICCECYTPAYDDMQCDWDVFVDVEFLYWYGRESDLTYAIKGQAVSLSSTVLTLAPTRYEHLKTKWDPGVRVGLGWKTCDGWDLSAYWTYYHNEKHNSTSVAAFTGTPSAGAFGLVNPWQNFAVASGFLLDHVSAKWDFHINQIDLELGRKYFLSKCFVMRNYAGLRGAWSHTNFHVDGAAPNVTTLEDSFRNKNWGVGLLAGFQPSWYFDDEFSLFADASFALLWGKFKERNRENYLFTSTGASPTTTNFNRSSSDNFFGMQPVIDLALGLRWETNWCENRYAFAIDAGWEHHIWFDYNNRTMTLDDITINSGTFTLNKKVNEVINNVAFGGFVLRARFDF